MAINKVFNKTTNADFTWLGDRLNAPNPLYDPNYIPLPGEGANHPIQYYYYLPANLDISNPEYMLSFAGDVNWADGKPHYLQSTSGLNGINADWNHVITGQQVNSQKIDLAQQQWANVFD